MKEGYKQTEIGMIPEDWEVKFLTAFGDVVSGGTPSTSVSEYWDGDIAWCTPSDITKTAGTTIAKTERCITAKGLFNSAAVLLPPGCVLLCTRATIGDSKINSVAMATNQGFKNIIPKNCDITFLFYLLQTKKQQMLEKAIGSTFLEISKSALCSIPMQYPPIPEQQSIAEALSDMDELISSLEKLIEKKKAIKQGAMQELLTGKRRLPGFSGEWRVTTIKSLGNVVTGSTPSRSNPHFWGGKHAWVTAQDFTSKYITSTVETVTDSGKNECRFVPKGSILVTCIASIGLNAITACECATNQQINSIICNSKYNNEFIYYQICSQIDLMRSIAGQTAVPIISKTQFEDIAICVPPTIHEQQAIGDTLASIDNEILELEDKLEKIVGIKKGMMQQLLTGKIRLK